MKEIITNLALFLVFCFAFSALTACSGTPGNLAVNNTAATPGAVTQSPSNGKTSVYPPLASGLADAEFELIDGGTFKISDHKGKALLLNIWGTWCGPCRAEMPHLVEMQETWGPKGFEVIGLNIGDGSGGIESNDQIKKFAATMKLNYTLARSTNAQTAQFYLVTKRQDIVPQSILVDGEGHLRGVFVGGGQRVIDSIKATVAKVMDGDQVQDTPPAAQTPQSVPTPAPTVGNSDGDNSKGGKRGEKK